MVNIAILGFGVVGSGVYEVIRKNYESIARRAGQEIDIKYILDIRDFSSHKESNLFVKDFNTILNDDEVSTVVEVIGGVDFAYKCTKEALMHGKNVVTSNKELVAKCGYELLQIAIDNNVKYYFEASVGGGIPIIRPLKLCLAANEISEIVGILNGTTNYILTQMIKNNKTLADALSEAQKKGYAERNPSADVDGFDACRKICILASLVFGRHVDCDSVYTKGIGNLTLEDVEYASKLGYAVKLLGHCKTVGDKIDAEVSPAFVPYNHPLATVDSVFNAILVKGDAIGDVMFYGRGAGKLPTASAVVADVIDIAKNSGPDASLFWTKSENSVLLDHGKSVKKYFVRVKTSDKNKALSDIKSIFGKTTIMDLYDGELGFVTDAVSEYDAKIMLSKLGLEIISKIKVL